MGTTYSISKKEQFDNFVDKLQKYIDDDTTHTKLSYSKGTRQQDGSYIEPYKTDDLNLTIFFINGSMIFVSINEQNQLITTINMSHDELYIKGYSSYKKISTFDYIYFWNNIDDFFIFLNKIKTIRRTHKWDWTGSTHDLLKYKERNYAKTKKLKSIYQNIITELQKNKITFTEDYDNKEKYEFELHRLVISVKRKMSMILQEYSDDNYYIIEIMANISEEEINLLNNNNINISYDADYIYHFYNVEDFIEFIILLSYYRI